MMKTALLILGLLAAPALVGYYIKTRHPTTSAQKPPTNPPRYDYSKGFRAN
jgi:hypothetical protein